MSALPPLVDRVTETEDEASVCYRINLPEYSSDDVKIRTIHEAATPDELGYQRRSRSPAAFNTTGISVIASNPVPGANGTQTQTLLFELRLPPQAKKTDQIRAFWRADKRQVVIVVQKEGKELVFRGLMRQYQHPITFLHSLTAPTRSKAHSDSDPSGSLDSLPR